MRIFVILQCLLLSLVVAGAETPAPSLASLPSGKWGKKVLVVAHRGASKQAPENTLPAFELAWKQGADAIEGDFRLTKDGQVVCIHDANTKRTTGMDLVVAGSTVSELRELDAGVWRGVAFRDTRIPTMAEVFSTIPAGKKIFIELKSGVEIIPALLEGLQQSELSTEQILVISFHKDVLKKLKAVAPQYKTSWLVGFKKDESGEIIPAYDAVLDTLSEIKADGLSSGRQLIDAAFVRHIMDKGIEHHVWTVDDTEVAKRLRSWGTRSVTSNVPADILAAFAEHPVKHLQSCPPTH